MISFRGFIGIDRIRDNRCVKNLSLLRYFFDVPCLVIFIVGVIAMITVVGICMNNTSLSWCPKQSGVRSLLIIGILCIISMLVIIALRVFLRCTDPDVSVLAPNRLSLSLSERVNEEVEDIEKNVAEK